MPQFAPDQVTFKDGNAYGTWDDSHYREHLQFVQILAGLKTPVLLPDYDFIQMLTAGGSRSSILTTHAAAHVQLRQATGVGGVDYSQFNLDQEDDFYNFTGYHATEHAALRVALGITT